MCAFPGASFGSFAPVCTNVRFSPTMLLGVRARADRGALFPTLALGVLPAGDLMPCGVRGRVGQDALFPYPASGVLPTGRRMVMGHQRMGRIDCLRVAGGRVGGRPAGQPLPPRPGKPGHMRAAPAATACCRRCVCYLQAHLCAHTHTCPNTAIATRRQAQDLEAHIHPSLCACALCLTPPLPCRCFDARLHACVPV